LIPISWASLNLRKPCLPDGHIGAAWVVSGTTTLMEGEADILGLRGDPFAAALIACLGCERKLEGARPTRGRRK